MKLMRMQKQEFFSMCRLPLENRRVLGKLVSRAAIMDPEGKIWLAFYVATFEPGTKEGKNVKKEMMAAFFKRFPDQHLNDPLRRAALEKMLLPKKEEGKLCRKYRSVSAAHYKIDLRLTLRSPFTVVPSICVSDKVSHQQIDYGPCAHRPRLQQETEYLVA